MKRIAKRRWEGKAALQLASKYRTVEVSSKGDDGVIEAGKKLNAYVLTNDRNLIKRLVDCGIKVITLRSNHLVIIHE